MKEGLTLALRNQSDPGRVQPARPDLSKIKPLADLSVAPGTTAGKWLVFNGIPPGIQIPTMIVHFPIAGKEVEINVNDAARRAMKLKVERIGPRGMPWRLLTVAGELNTVNIGTLTGVLETLVGQKVVRAVIRFSESAPSLEGTVLSWLQQGAETAGRSEEQQPANARFSGRGSRNCTLRQSQIARRQISTAPPDPILEFMRPTLEAVQAALKTAVEVLPHEELLAEIESGHPLTRVAALADGGGRLAVEDLPLVLKYADGNSPQMQLAAARPRPQAFWRTNRRSTSCSRYARRNVEPMASLAIESLAASRYAAANQALLDVLRNEHPASRRLIVRACWP